MIYSLYICLHYVIKIRNTKPKACYFRYVTLNVYFLFPKYVFNLLTLFNRFEHIFFFFFFGHLALVGLSSRPGLNLPYSGSAESLPLDHQEVAMNTPLSWVFCLNSSVGLMISKACFHFKIPIAWKDILDSHRQQENFICTSR